MPSPTPIGNIKDAIPVNSSVQAGGGTPPAKSIGNVRDAVPITGTQKTASKISLGSIGKSVYDFFSGTSQAFGNEIGNSIAAPEDVQKYSDTLNQHNEITQNVLAAIKQKKSLGQDTSKLEEALKDQMTSVPQLKDFVDPATLRRLGQTFGQNLEETLGLAGGTALEAIGGGALEEGIGQDALQSGIGNSFKLTKATDSGLTLGQKIIQGMKVGGAFGAAGGASGAAANEGSVGDVVKSTLEGGALGTAVGAGAGAVGSAISNKLQGKSIFGDLAKVPAKLTGDEGALIKVPEAKQTILDTQSAIKSSTANPDLPPASKTLGSKILGNIITKANSMLDAIGERMGAVLKDPKIGGAPADVSAQTSEFDKKFSALPPVSTRSDTILLRDFQSDIAKITGGGETVEGGGRIGSVKVPGSGEPATLKGVDDFLRKWQKVDASYQMQNNSVGALIDSTVHNINEEAKNIADKSEGAEPGQGEYSKTNDEYAELVENRNDAQKEAGKQRKATGIYDKANSIIKSQSNPDTASEAWRVLANQTGTPLGQPSALIRTVEQIYDGEKAEDYLKTLRIGFSLKMTAVRTLQNLLVKSENDPDAIVAKMLKFIDDNAAKQTKG